MVSSSEKVEKKVYVKAGFTESQRTKNLDAASEKWEREGWSVVNKFDGGLTKTSYVVLEKPASESFTSSPEEGRSVGVFLGIGIFLLPVIFSWFTLRKGHTVTSRIASFAWMILPVVFLGMSGENKNSTSTAYNEDRVASATVGESIRNNVNETATLPFTIEGFLKKYNQSFRTLDHPIKVSIKNENDNGKSLIVQLKASSKNIALIVGANNRTRAVESITFIGGIDETTESGLDVMFGSTAVVMAVENPNMSIDQRRGVVDDLGLLDDTKSNHNVVRDGVKYSLSYSDMIGFMLVVEPVQ